MWNVGVVVEWMTFSEKMFAIVLPQEKRKGGEGGLSRTGLYSGIVGRDGCVAMRNFFQVIDLPHN